MKFTVYKITNLINSKIYIGTHKTQNINDNYMGSGKAIIKSIKKYGIENFNKDTLFIFNNYKDMMDKETELVDSDFVKRHDTYNMKVGGKGGWDHIDSSGENNPNFGNHSPLSSEHKAKIGASVSGELNGMFGKTHSDEVKEKLRVINSVKLELRIGKEKADNVKLLASKRFKGIPKSDSQKKLMSESAKELWKNRPEVTCPHCGKEGRGGAMKQWHFDKCKFKVE